MLPEADAFPVQGLVRLYSTIELWYSYIVAKKPDCSHIMPSSTLSDPNTETGRLIVHSWIEMIHGHFFNSLT